MSLTRISSNIVKFDETEEGLIVYGKATGPDLDIDQQICDPTWLKTAMPAWMQWGNMREGHSSIAAGVGLELEETDGSNWQLKSLCVDPTTQRKIKAGVLKGQSIGIKGARVVKDAAAPGGRIVGGEIVEISYVDRPANPTARIDIGKSASTAAAMTPVAVDDQQSKLDTLPLTDTEKITALEAELAAAKSAMPGGGFPIANVEDLKNAIQAIGRAKNPAAAKAHIKAEAAKLGQAKLIPDSWKTVDPDVTKANDDEWTHDPALFAQVRDGLAQLMQAELDELMKGEDEVWDLSDLLCSLQTFLMFWGHEAAEGEDPSPQASLTAQGDVDMDLTTLGVSADIIKAARADDATDEAKAAPLAELRKQLGVDPDLLKTTITDAVKAAAEESTRGLEERLRTVEDMAAPGGAARTRTQANATKAAEADRLKTEADRYRHMAGTVEDPALSHAYRQKAVALDTELAGLTG